jgi:hypothetical protein
VRRKYGSGINACKVYQQLTSSNSVVATATIRPNWEGCSIGAVMLWFGVMADPRLTAVRALRWLFDSAQCVNASLRAPGLLSQVRTEIRPGWNIVGALAVLSRPNAFDAREHSQLADADARRFNKEGPRQADLTIAWILEVPLSDEAALADEDFDALPNCLVTLFVIQLATPLSARSIHNDPRDL